MVGRDFIIATEMSLLPSQMLIELTGNSICDSFFHRVCFDTQEGHQSTVWAISFDRTGEYLGKLIKHFCQNPNR